MNWSNLWTATYETLLMTIISSLLAYVIGIPLGVLLFMTSKNGPKPNKWVNIIVGGIVNILRSVPCMLLIIILLPLTRSLLGRGTGAWYTMLIPLFFASFPFVSRMVEQSLSEVKKDEIEALESMGASNLELVKKVLVPESKPSLISGFSVSTISILAYTSFAYDFGAGGLISRAYSFYSAHSGNYLSFPNVWIIILIVLIIVQLIQELGLYIAHKVDKRKVN